MESDSMRIPLSDEGWASENVVAVALAHGQGLRAISLSEAATVKAGLADALEAAGPAPCQNCALFDSCALRNLACLAFKQFVDGKPRKTWAETLLLETATNLLPTREIYDAIFVGDHSRKPNNRPGRPSQLLRRGEFFHNS